MTLDEANDGVPVHIVRVGGHGSFRRRLLELGLLPGTRVTRLRVAPLGDPMEIWLRGCTLSLRRQDAAQIEVAPLAMPAPGDRA